MDAARPISNERQYDINWRDLIHAPTIELKFGTDRMRFPLEAQATPARKDMSFRNEHVSLAGVWKNLDASVSTLSLSLTNISKKSLRITRLVFPADNGIDNFLKNFSPKTISFLRNGYQSWSTARSYGITDRPLRPWLHIVSSISGNTSNLPSHTLGIFSSEMYSIISDSANDEAFLVGQAGKFDQLFYIKLHLYPRTKKSHFEVIFDFGRKMIAPGETIALDEIVLAKGEKVTLQQKYFDHIKQSTGFKPPRKSYTGWSSWYYYFNNITPEIIYKNLAVIKKFNIPLDVVQIDDGYMKLVGDWLTLKPAFAGRMKELAGEIRSAGFTPGIWLAPFIADRTSDLARYYPEFLLRTEFGKPITAGYNPTWPGKFYFSLDVTHPLVEEYITHVVETYTKEWGFSYLKLDFMFAASIRGGNHVNLRLSRSEALKHGMHLIRSAAGKSVTISGCGMPLSPAIGLVDSMRVGPDTAPYWSQFTGSLLRTAAMYGVRNSIRNSFVRCFMNKRLWVNDPDCLMLRDKNTKLTKYERMSHMHAVIITGGSLFFSDNFEELPQLIIDRIPVLLGIAAKCYRGETIPLDYMEREIPEMVYNTSGYLAVFNFSRNEKPFSIPAGGGGVLPKTASLVDVWSGERFESVNGSIALPKLKRHASMLLSLSR